MSVDWFFGRRVHVKCCDDYEVDGVLVGYGLSRHGRKHPQDYGVGNIGALVLKLNGFDKWVLIKCWRMIYTLEGE